MCGEHGKVEGVYDFSTKAVLDNGSEIRELLLDAEQTCQVTGIDLAKERHSKAMVVVEVKKQGDDMDSAVSQGLSYVEWLFKYRERLKPGINPF